MRSGVTPQERLSWRQTRASVLKPMIGQFGRNFEIIRAVFPDFVTVIIAAAPRSCAVVHVAWEMAVVTSGFVSTSRSLKRLI